MTKPKPEKADQDNNRKVIAFTIHPELLNGLDTEAAKLKISRSEVVNRILLAHFDPKPPQVNQNDFKAMQATVEQISEAVNKLLSERPLIAAPSVQKPLIDKQNDNKGILPDWFTSEKPTFEELISDYTPAKFGQWLADNIPSLSPELQSQYKARWQTADPNTLNGLRQYGSELIGAIKAGSLKLHPDQARGIGRMDDRELRKALINLAGITF